MKNKRKKIKKLRKTADNLIKLNTELRNDIDILIDSKSWLKILEVQYKYKNLKERELNMLYGMSPKDIEILTNIKIPKNYVGFCQKVVDQSTNSINNKEKPDNSTKGSQE